MCTNTLFFALILSAFILLSFLSFFVSLIRFFFCLLLEQSVFLFISIIFTHFQIAMHRKNALCVYVNQLLLKILKTIIGCVYCMGKLEQCVAIDNTMTVTVAAAAVDVVAIAALVATAVHLNQYVEVIARAIYTIYIPCHAMPILHRE